ncbi:hypothetical protein [Schlesneria paludicola]|uniref:hypothetical protein n=1 Tax=Schlesneria paludicola TaxID=360056 RepID=UPI00029AE01C|nr:hypothetical protein [Schlesneria paludicola]
MQAARGQSAFVSCLAMGLILVSSGCAVGGKSFAIDSNSRVPFFGLELKERKAKDKAPSYRSISQSEGGQSRFQPALQTGTSSSSRLLKQKDLRNGGLRVAAMSEDTRPSAESLIRTAPSAVPLSQPLPMKDVRPTPEPSDRTGAILDFQ